jgi:hypothetical protein
MNNLLKLAAAALFFCPALSSAAGTGALSQLSGPAYSPLALPVPVPAITTGGDKAYSDAVSYTSFHAPRLAAMAGNLQQFGFRDGGQNGQDLYFWWGAPRGVTQLRPAQVGVMRHWTSNGQVDGTPVVDLIVNSGKLKAGPRMYIVPESHRAEYYYDLHGVFYTTPDFRPGDLWMGLTADSDYVDFVVHPNMGTLYLAPGNYLFPCPLKNAPWMEEAYKKWKQTGALPPGMDASAFSQIEREGGLHSALDIPITVVQYQKNGKVTVLRPDLLKKPY